MKRPPLCPAISPRAILTAAAAFFAFFLRFFTEVLLDDTPQAFLRVDQTVQRIQALEPARYRLAAAGLRQGALVAVKVGLGVEQHAARLFAVTAGAANLLNVAVHGERQTGMDHQTHIRIVDAETERIGRNHDRLFAAHERLLRRLALCVLHLAVVLADRVVARLEPLAQPLDELHGRAVDDDGTMLVPLAQLALDRLEQRVFNRLAALAIARLAAAVDALDVQAQVIIYNLRLFRLNNTRYRTLFFYIRFAFIKQNAYFCVNFTKASNNKRP